MTRGARLYLEDIKESIAKIQRYVQGQTHADFVNDDKTVDSVVRNLEVIGEAARSMPEDVKESHPEVPWDEIIGMRNKIAHEYFGIDHQIIWKTIQDDLPLLLKQINRI
jgi:uncharacterized protein with HEPN domain